MSDVTLEHALQMIAQLSPEDRNLLVHGLKATEPVVANEHVTRETILAEHAWRLAANESDHTAS